MRPDRVEVLWDAAEVEVAGPNRNWRRDDSPSLRRTEECRRSDSSLGSSENRIALYAVVSTNLHIILHARISFYISPVFQSRLDIEPIQRIIDPDLIPLRIAFQGCGIGRRRSTQKQNAQHASDEQRMTEL